MLRSPCDVWAFDWGSGSGAGVCGVRGLSAGAAGSGVGPSSVAPAACSIGIERLSKDLLELIGTRIDKDAVIATVLVLAPVCLV